MKKGGLSKIIIVAILSAILCNITGIIIAAFGFIATEYSQVIQSLVWIANVLWCVIVVGSITLIILKRKSKYFFCESKKVKLKYIVSSFCLAYIISALFVIIGKQKFEVLYVTSLIVVLTIIGTIGGIISWLIKTENS